MTTVASGRLMAWRIWQRVQCEDHWGGAGSRFRFKFILAVCYWRICWPPHTLPVESGCRRTVQTCLTRGGCDCWWMCAASRMLSVRVV